MFHIYYNSSESNGSNLSSLASPGGEKKPWSDARDLSDLCQPITSSKTRGSRGLGQPITSSGDPSNILPQSSVIEILTS